MQEAFHFSISDFSQTKWQLLNWSSRFNSCCFLDNHLYDSPWQNQECLVAAGARHQLQANAGHALQQLAHFADQHKGEWIFGHLGYGLAMETEGLHSRFATTGGFDDLGFFVPQYVVQLGQSAMHIYAGSAAEAREVWQQISDAPATISASSAGPVQYEPVVTRQAYLDAVRHLLQHIRRGDCYEINYCQEFVAEGVERHPVQLYHQLSRLSPNPFSCLYRQQQHFLVCASPERFLQKKGDRLISQPIKGTAPRNITSTAADTEQRLRLQASEKDRRENVMVVDLVRNDLSRICQKGTVKVDELFGVYTYPQVHQMISTISGLLQPGHSLADILQATFPMGSMTGAPKKRVVELIDRYEASPRDLFSGSVGYLAPNGDFDFNVVIRSIQYNQDSGRLSFHVGGGITAYSHPEAEYEECMLKASAIRTVLQQS